MLVGNIHGTILKKQKKIAKAEEVAGLIATISNDVY
jgi:hypothetical protein